MLRWKIGMKAMRKKTKWGPHLLDLFLIVSGTLVLAYFWRVMAVVGTTNMN